MPLPYPAIFPTLYTPAQRQNESHSRQKKITLYQLHSLVFHFYLYTCLPPHLPLILIRKYPFLHSPGMVMQKIQRSRRNRFIYNIILIRYPLTHTFPLSLLPVTQFIQISRHHKVRIAPRTKTHPGNKMLIALSQIQSYSSHFIPGLFKPRFQVTIHGMCIRVPVLL